SNTSFKLNGYLNGNTWFLTESNSKGETTGFLEAQTDGQFMWGKWRNTKNQIYIPFTLSKDKQNVKGAWIKKFTGKLSEESVEVFVQKYLDKAYAGYAYFKEQGLFIPIKGIDAENKQTSLLLYAETNNSIFSSIEINLQKDEIYDVAILDAKGGKKYSTLNLKDEFPFEVNHFADFYNIYDSNYPKLNHKFFDTWMQEKMETWIKESTKSSKIQQVINQGNQSDLRFSNQMLSWVEIDYFLNNIVSDRITFQDPNKKEFIKENFILDLKSKKELTVENIFNDYKGVRKWVEREGKEKLLTQSIIAESALLTEWIKNQSFSNTSIREHSIIFSTSYDP
ncbi:MAG: hypothetical protein AAGK97_18510, partial [Bacteroidota bacterium]